MNKETALQLLSDMVRTRKFEETLQRFFDEGKMHGTTHLCIGEEASYAGACRALQPGDDMFATHRGHGASLCRGISMKGMMAEMFGKADGVCGGYGGSMHMADVEKGIYGANGIVGAAMPLACGAALANKKRGLPFAAMAFFGDGATNEGVFHESMNLASLWELPVLFVCTNNHYGMSTSIDEAMKITDIAGRAVPYGIRAVTVDGNDAEAVYEAVKEARQIAVSSPEPVLLVLDTYRISGHSKSDCNYYREQREIDAWRAKDPIALFEEKMAGRGILTREEMRRTKALAEEEVREAVLFAENSPEPKLEELTDHVYAS